ncbi:hypothetical protein KQY30_18550 [Streptomyces sp. GMY02]|uniref:hypothetical protein n=1 Tax=Streptomyces sp. GMY02 TaxID=1333528 RepID=UPI001C2C4F21|nr:hypothetical protein [Streptomyces sp. GMY02]QXE35963.1 hypothetical protein KQY30_18550 [Streptomyces sp. GMY02]
MEKSNKGSESRVCSGTFVSRDGRLVNTKARMTWPGANAGDRIAVRSVVLGGYVEESGDSAALAVTLTSVMAAVSMGSAFAGLPWSHQNHLIAKLPRWAFAQCAKWWS